MQYEDILSPEAEAEIHEALRPSGFRLLVALPKVAEKVGNIFVPDARRSDEATASVVVKVIAVGPDAYVDRERFPTGALCSVGDHVLIAPYSGHRLKVGGHEVRIINDDSVLGIVMNAEKVSRAYDR